MLLPTSVWVSFGYTATSSQRKPPAHGRRRFADVKFDSKRSNKRSPQTFADGKQFRSQLFRECPKRTQWLDYHRGQENRLYGCTETAKGAGASASGVTSTFSGTPGTARHSC
eukprot:6808228-Prymnesium_polylepis.1